MYARIAHGGINYRETVPNVYIMTFNLAYKDTSIGDVDKTEQNLDLGSELRFIFAGNSKSGLN